MTAASLEPSVTVPAGRAGTVRVHDTWVQAWEEHVDEPGMFQVYRSLLARLVARGWTVTGDPNVERNYPSLSRTHAYGRKGDLEMCAETMGRTAKVEFFQNVANVENRNGGRHDFNKFARLPRAMRLSCVVEMTHMVRRLVEWGYDLDEKFERGWPLLRAVLARAEDRFADESPLAVFNREWSDDRFQRDASGWPAAHEYIRSQSDHDRDGRTIRNGEVHYARHDGRIVRGEVYTCMNGNWRMYSGGAFVGWFQAYELFAVDHPEREPRRLVDGQADRLHRELEKALKAKRYDRVAALGRVLVRLGAA